MDTITEVLETAGFEVYSVARGNQDDATSIWSAAGVGADHHNNKDWGLEQAVQRWKMAWGDASNDNTKKRKRHVEQCVECRGELESSRSSKVLMAKSPSYNSFEDVSFVEKGCSTILPADQDDLHAPLESVTPSTPELFRATFSIEGMTCSACTGNVSQAISQHSFVQDVNVNLLSNSATVTFSGKSNEKEIIESIEDAGYDASLNEVEALSQKQPHLSDQANGDALEHTRNISVRVEGIYCHHCPERVQQSITETFGNQVRVNQLCSTSDPLLKISYEPRPPSFTAREILNTINDVSSELHASIWHPRTIEERSKEIQTAERRKLLLRFALSLVTAIPTFIIGIVYMTLVASDNPGRRYLMTPMWAGQVTKADWALFIMGTIVYFFAADVFHIRTFESLRAMWRPGSPVSLADRFFRFGNMNMLISLGTSIAYFASIAALAINATHGSAGDGTQYYFDSVVFLTMFLLAGRFLEAYSKAKTGDAVTALGSLRPSETLLVLPDATPGSSSSVVQKTPTELLEVGDIVRVPHGESPPFDSTIIVGKTKFDESSLTGEARLIQKVSGDMVYSGTINKGASVDVQLTSISGASMLDQIIKVVREGQTKRAPVERVADVLTSRFVPFVVLVGILTWIIWLALGLSGALPDDYLDSQTGGWPFWSLQFSIAVFVVACPCGIGLAAPTALFVGGGLAAKHGILVKGGGEAFQEASQLDCIVFDKTGTLTQGKQPAVTQYKLLEGDEAQIMKMARILEEHSNHPIARAIVEHSKTTGDTPLQSRDTEEIPGKGIKGTFDITTEEQIEAIIGNEPLMAEYGVTIDAQSRETIEDWKMQGMSIALLATKTSPSSTFRLSAAFAISDPLRPEAPVVVKWLQDQGLEVWMVSGDNATTANSVGKAVGIPASNVMAGVLPEQKADKIKYLQRTVSARRSRGWFGIGRRAERATVAMCGDGINDSPALATADVSIAIGSGSDVALSTASFVLVSSDLKALIRLIELSQVVFRRVKINFGWALVYNLVALPVAAGVLYAITSGGKHVRLDPVWASLAMALSSVSVVSSSLLLRTKIPLVGFRAPK